MVSKGLNPGVETGNMGPRGGDLTRERVRAPSKDLRPASAGRRGVLLRAPERVRALQGFPTEAVFEKAWGYLPG